MEVGDSMELVTSAEPTLSYTDLIRRIESEIVNEHNNIRRAETGIAIAKARIEAYDKVVAMLKRRD